MTIEERLERLERNNRRLLVGLVTVILFGVGVAATPNNGKDIFDEVRARAIFVVDRNNNPRVWLYVDKDGPTLSMFSENGNASAHLSVTNGWSGIILHNENGKMWSTP